MSRTVSDIEAEMRELYPRKEIAYIDYAENTGSHEDLRDRLWREYDELRQRWNKLVEERKSLLAEGSFFRIQFDDGFPEFISWRESKEELRRHFASAGYTISKLVPLV